MTQGARTFFYLDDGIDSGDIVWQRTFLIPDADEDGVEYTESFMLFRERG